MACFPSVQFLGTSNLNVLCEVILFYSKLKAFLSHGHSPWYLLHKKRHRPKTVPLVFKSASQLKTHRILIKESGATVFMHTFALGNAGAKLKCEYPDLRYGGSAPPASVSYLPTGFPIVDDLRPRGFLTALRNGLTLTVPVLCRDFHPVPHAGSQVCLKAPAPFQFIKLSCIIKRRKTLPILCANYSIL